MSTLKELLSAALAEGTVSEEFNTQAVEAYDFDTADYGEQLNTLTGERDTAAEANANAATEIAALNEKLSQLETDLIAVKAMNFDKLMSGESAGSPAGDPEGEGDEDNSNTEPTFEELFAKAEKEI